MRAKKINEAIRHLTPRPDKEVNKNLREEIENWIGDGLSGSTFITENMMNYFDKIGINVDSVEYVADELIITIFYEYLKKDEKKLAEAIRIAIENIKRTV